MGYFGLSLIASLKSAMARSWSSLLYQSMPRLPYSSASAVPENSRDSIARVQAAIAMSPPAFKQVIRSSSGLGAAPAADGTSIAAAAAHRIIRIIITLHVPECCPIRTIARRQSICHPGSQLLQRLETSPAPHLHDVRFGSEADILKLSTASPLYSRKPTWRVYEYTP